MNKRQKLRVIRKICRSVEDWHFNASANWDIDRFFKEIGDTWCITKFPKFQIYLDREIYRWGRILDKRTVGVRKRRRQ